LAIRDRPFDGGQSDPISKANGQLWFLKNRKPEGGAATARGRIVVFFV
jgi:hypothetical protein